MNFTDLPQDLESEILCRVPATSLNQLRFTCKRWYALFKDPSFIRKNLSKAARLQVILKNNHRVYSVNINFGGINNSFDPSIEFTGKLKKSSTHEDVKITKIFHCDGLLLGITRRNGRIIVWNPCTGKTRWIQPSDRNTALDYVLGYGKNNKSCNSYKILSSSSTNGVVEFEIYEFNSNSWRLVEDVTEYNWKTRSFSVSLKGNAYWIASDHVGNIFLQKFDFKRERFERLSLPFQISSLEQNHLLLSVVREEKLSLLLERRYEMKIWVTDTKIDEEAKDSKIQYLLVANLDRFLVAGMTSVESFLLDEEKKMVVYCRREMANKKKTIIYIVGEDILRVCKQVHGETTKESEDYWPLLLSYVPSLVHIPQATPTTRKRKR